jgi:TerC family integral membrane protein
LTPWWLWGALAGGLLAVLVLDLLVFHRRPDEIRPRQAIAWSVVWLALGLGFGLVVWSVENSTAAREYLTGYLIERTLSLDNLFVLAVLLGYFAVPRAIRHRALLWGIVGALVFRALFIAAGGVALERLSWLAYVLGAFLVLTGIRIARREIEVKPERNRVVALIRRFVPMTERFHGQRLFVRAEGKLVATPMVVVFAAIATTDVAFATDSIPAIYAVTDDPFLVFAANAFSVLGMLALYFLLAEIMVRFRYLRPALAVILVFVGLKMALSDIYELPISLSLAVIAVVIATALVASLLAPAPAVPDVHRRVAPQDQPSLRAMAPRADAGDRSSASLLTNARIGSKPGGAAGNRRTVSHCAVEDRVDELQAKRRWSHDCHDDS